MVETSRTVWITSFITTQHYIASFDRNTIFANITNVHHDVILVSIQFRCLRSIRYVIFCPFDTTSYRSTLCLRKQQLVTGLSHRLSRQIIMVEFQYARSFQPHTDETEQLILSSWQQPVSRFLQNQKLFPHSWFIPERGVMLLSRAPRMVRAPEFGGRSSNLGVFMCSC